MVRPVVTHIMSEICHDSCHIPVMPHIQAWSDSWPVPESWRAAGCQAADDRAQLEAGKVMTLHYTVHTDSWVLSSAGCQAADDRAQLEAGKVGGHMALTYCDDSTVY